MGIGMALFDPPLTIPQKRPPINSNLAD